MGGKEYLTGSRAFFDGMDGFEPHDTDVVVFKPKQWPFVVQCRKGDRTVFSLQGDTAAAILGHLESHPEPAMQVCMLLVPEIAERVGMTVEDLPRVQHLIDALDERHKYLAVIYGAYVKNKAFKLYKYQRAEAFKVYKQNRKDNGRGC